MIKIKKITQIYTPFVSNEMYKVVTLNHYLEIAQHSFNYFNNWQVLNKNPHDEISYSNCLQKQDENQYKRNYKNYFVKNY